MLKNRICRGASAFPSVLAFWLLVQFAPSLMAQTATTGVLRGSVTDTSGRVVANALIDPERGF
jgi:hypothetical protein